MDSHSTREFIFQRKEKEKEYSNTNKQPLHILIDLVQMNEGDFSGICMLCQLHKIVVDLDGEKNELKELEWD